ncbi:hypothetical protein SAMN04488109_5326 [Chryseolinea serpens]|uniref:DoxX-like family protein n=1 Tax=Chryseolinea serpens TaxID=947013 RepID=A0A1M5VRT2_9BACT|nr:DoxX family protein [Chryseolinea serpens]SHH77684.1 hypothetical protein SAMN04488109_5326 [Chryseolinea serpens]
MNKRKKILSWIPSILMTVIIGGGAIMKLSAAPPLVDLFTQIGLLLYLPWLGVAELLFVAFFLYNRSMNIGLLLLTGYFGGAMAVELSHGTVPLLPVLFSAACGSPRTCETHPFSGPVLAMMLNL